MSRKNEKKKKEMSIKTKAVYGSLGTVIIVCFYQWALSFVEQIVHPAIETNGLMGIIFSIQEFIDQLIRCVKLDVTYYSDTWFILMCMFIIVAIIFHLVTSKEK